MSQDSVPGPAREEARGGGASVFAVKATSGHEQEVADGLRERAIRERVPVVAVIVPRPGGGHLYVECADHDRLTNLVGSVRHARGVVSPKGSGASAEIPLSTLEPFLEAREFPSDEEVFKAASVVAELKKQAVSLRRPERATSKAAQRGASPEPAASDEGQLPPLTPTTARLLNAAIVLPLVVLVVGTYAAPKLFWDGFLYPNFWAPIEADANNAGGLAESYNVFNTIAYALILVPAILFIYRVLERLEVKVDTRFVLMLAPFLVLGGAARALEDAVYYEKPMSYAFISPIIYVAEGFLVLGLIVASWWVARVTARKGTAWGAAAWSASFAPGAAALLYFQVIDTRFVAAPLPLPLVLASLACAYLAGLILVSRPGGPSVHALVAIAGFLLLGLSCYLIARWALLGGWLPGSPAPVATHMGEAPIILLVAAGATAATLAALWALSARAQWLAPLLSPINALLYFGHFLDGAATYWGVNFFGYHEKHVVAGTLIDVTGTALVMFPMKLAFITGVLIVIDVVFRRDLYDSADRPSSYVGLLKLTVLALGMGPGVRDMLRLAMGV